MNKIKLEDYKQIIAEIQKLLHERDRCDPAIRYYKGKYPLIKLSKDDGMKKSLYYCIIRKEISIIPYRLCFRSKKEK